jgi:hypothetical protein
MKASMASAVDLVQQKPTLSRTRQNILAIAAIGGVEFSGEQSHA